MCWQDAFRAYLHSSVALHNLNNYVIVTNASHKMTVNLKSKSFIPITGKHERLPVYLLNRTNPIVVDWLLPVLKFY